MPGRNRPAVVVDPRGQRWHWHPVAASAPWQHFGLYLPEDTDQLLDAALAAGAADAPYYALLWPAGEALARWMLKGPALSDQKVLDLGAGTGVVALAAACQGAHVVAVDAEAHAFGGLAASAAVLGVPAPAVGVSTFAHLARPERFDRVVAADVLYEPELAADVAACAERHLAPKGEVWVADPGRAHAARLDQAMDTEGLALVSNVRIDAPPSKVHVTLRRYTRRP